MLQRFLIKLFLSLLVILPACAGGSPGASGETPQAGEPAARVIASPPAQEEPWRRDLLAAFDRVWTTLRDHYFDPQLGGLDWQGVRARFRPQIARAKSPREAYALMNRVLGLLKVSHLAVVPMDEASAETGPAGFAEPGLDLRMIAGHALVTRVDPDSPAARAGVRSGFELLAVAGRPLAPRLAALRRGLKGSTLQPLLLRRFVKKLLEGPENSTVLVDFQDGHGVRLQKSLRRAPPQGRAARLGPLAGLRVRFVERTLKGGIGYIGFDGFLDPGRIMPAFEKAIATHLQDPGIILDLRGNPGGLGFMACGMAGYFVSKQDLYLGTMQTRTFKLRFVVNPRELVYQGRLAILVDTCSASTAEIMAAGLKDLGRARIFGERTPGAALPSQLEKLPGGALFQYVVANYVSRGGQVLEGRGVAPDMPVSLTRATLLKNEDPVIAAAANWILSKKTK